MPGDTDAAERADDDPAETRADDDSAAALEGADRRVVDRRLLSDLSVNAVPIAIIAAFVLGFVVLSGSDHDPLLVFHAALIGGVLLVSAVAGWAVAREDAPLEGSAADVGEELGDD